MKKLLNKLPEGLFFIFRTCKKQAHGGFRPPVPMLVCEHGMVCSRLCSSGSTHY